MNANTPPEVSGKSLAISCLVAVLLGIVVLIVVVYPAEFGKDPTGLGAKMGLLTLAQPGSVVKPAVEQPIIVQLPASPDQSITQTPAKQLAAVGDSASATPQLAKSRYHENDKVTLIIPPSQGLEYKFHLFKDETMEYHWKTDGSSLYFDFHGEPQGDTSRYFKSFIVKTDKSSQGTFSAPFEGSHGWYWENSRPFPVKVELVTRGHYDVIGEIKTP